MAQQPPCYVHIQWRERRFWSVLLFLFVKLIYLAAAGLGHGTQDRLCSSWQAGWFLVRQEDSVTASGSAARERT